MGGRGEFPLGDTRKQNFRRLEGKSRFYLAKKEENVLCCRNRERKQSSAKAKREEMGELKGGVRIPLEIEVKTAELKEVSCQKLLMALSVAEREEVFLDEVC